MSSAEKKCEQPVRYFYDEYDGISALEVGRKRYEMDKAIVGARVNSGIRNYENSYETGDNRISVNRSARKNRRKFFYRQRGHNKKMMTDSNIKKILSTPGINELVLLFVGPRAFAHPCCGVVDPPSWSHTHPGHYLPEDFACQVKAEQALYNFQDIIHRKPVTNKVLPLIITDRYDNPTDWALQPQWGGCANIAKLFLQQTDESIVTFFA